MLPLLTSRLGGDSSPPSRHSTPPSPRSCRPPLSARRPPLVSLLRLFGRPSPRHCRSSCFRSSWLLHLRTGAKLAEVRPAGSGVGKAQRCRPVQGRRHSCALRKPFERVDRGLWRCVRGVNALFREAAARSGCRVDVAACCYGLVCALGWWELDRRSKIHAWYRSAALSAVVSISITTFPARAIALPP